MFASEFWLNDLLEFSSEISLYQQEQSTKMFIWPSANWDDTYVAFPGVALLPFVDERRLRAALEEVYPDLTPEESKTCKPSVNHQFALWAVLFLFVTFPRGCICCSSKLLTLFLNL